MPAKKVTKKVAKKSSPKQSRAVGSKKEQHLLHRHISVTSPLGMLLALAFLIAATAVASAGYKAINAKPVGVNEVRTDNAVKRVEITGVVSREQEARGAVARYVLTTSDNVKYELVGMNSGLLERMEKMPNERKDTPEPVVYNLKKQDQETRRYEQKTQMREEIKKSKSMTEGELLNKNYKVLNTYIGKTVTVLGSLVGKMPKSSPANEQIEKAQFQSELPQFVVKTITVVQ